MVAVLKSAALIMRSETRACFDACCAQEGLVRPHSHRPRLSRNYLALYAIPMPVSVGPRGRGGWMLPFLSFSDIFDFETGEERLPLADFWGGVSVGHVASSSGSLLTNVCWCSQGNVLVVKKCRLCLEFSDEP